MNTHERVIQKREKFTGCTVHYVTPKLDSGKIIIQKKVRVYKKDNPKTLSKKVLLLEHQAYPEALQKICSYFFEKKKLISFFALSRLSDP